MENHKSLVSLQVNTQQRGTTLLQVYLLIYLNNLHQLMWFACAQEVKPVLLYRGERMN